MAGQDSTGRLRDALVSRGGVSEEWVRSVCAQHAAYAEARRAGRQRWPELTPVAFVESEKPHLGFLAWAAWHDVPYDGAEDLCAREMRRFGAAFFEGRPGDADIEPGTPIGQILIRLGALSEDQLSTALALQQDIAEATGVHIFLGILLIRKGMITMGEYYQAVGIHYGIPFSQVDDQFLADVGAACQRPPT